MRQLRYNLFAYLSKNFALVDTGKVIEKQHFAVVNSERAYNIFVQNVRAEVSRQFSAIDQTLAGLLHILRYVFCRLGNIVLCGNVFEVVTPELFQKVRVLVCSLHTVVSRVVVFYLFEFSYHFAVGNIENAASDPVIHGCNAFRYLSLRRLIVSSLLT